MRQSELKDTVGRLEAALPVVARIEGVDERLTEIRRAERELRGLLPKTEVAERMLDWLRSVSRDFATPGQAASYDFSSRALDAVRTLSEDRPRPPHFQSARDVFVFFTWALLPALEESIPEAVDALQYEAGRPAEERRRLRAELVAERAALVVERRHLVEQAVEAGISISHLDETQRSIEREQAREQAEELALRDQERLAHEIDARHEQEQGARKTRSAYLASERTTT